MGVDTYLIVPLIEGQRLELFGTVETGEDFLALYEPSRFEHVRRDPFPLVDHLLASLPPSVTERWKTEPILFVPEVGQSFAHRRYAELVADDGSLLVDLHARPERIPESRVSLTPVPPSKVDLLELGKVWVALDALVPIVPPGDDEVFSSEAMLAHAEVVLAVSDEAAFTDERRPEEFEVALALMWLKGFYRGLQSHPSAVRRALFSQ